MSAFDRIVTSAPLNKTAAVVTGASTVEADNDSRTERHRNLIRMVTYLERRIATATDSETKRRLGQQKLLIQQAIQQERGQRKVARGISALFMDSAREMLPRALFSTILRDAQKRLAAGEDAAQ